VSARGARRAFVVVGLGLGDEGKGSLVDALVREQAATLVVRFNGGCQAAHHVVSPEGKVHCFSQLGAGTLVPGVETWLSRFVAVDPLALEREEAALRRLGVEDAFARLCLDPRAVVVTPAHAAMNRLREVLRGEARHGSVGLGVGEALLDAERPGTVSIRVGDARSPEKLARSLRLLGQMKLDLAEQLVEQAGARLRDLPEIEAEMEALRRLAGMDALVASLHRLIEERGVRLREGPDLDAHAVTIFEGAQGVLLDRDHGFFPHVTPSRTTFAQARALLDEASFSGVVTQVGVLRAYATRHGRGPLVSEERALADALPEAHNGAAGFQGAFRTGWLDAVATRFALRVTGGVDVLALTHLDRLAGLNEVRVCTAYRLEGAIDPRIAGRVRWDERGGVARIVELSGMEGASFAEREALTALLGRCTPEYRALPGWRDAEDATLEDFLHFLESDEALGTPISRLSFGPRARDQIPRGPSIQGISRRSARSFAEGS
jgi:adenylosuccinate synthase